MQEYFMKLAMKEARQAFLHGEVPVGAVIVKDGQVVSRSRNMREIKQNALCHAEILAIDKACKKLGTTHLDGCEMYVTLEPCPMCSGAIVFARLSKVLFALSDQNYGCAGSVYNYLADSHFEHKVKTSVGLLQDESKELLQEFFSLVRSRNKLKSLIGKTLPSDYKKLFGKDFMHTNKKLLKHITSSPMYEVGKNGLHILHISQGHIVGIIQSLESFDNILVESSEEIDVNKIHEIAKIPVKHKIITIEGIAVFQGYKNK